MIPVYIQRHFGLQAGAETSAPQTLTDPLFCHLKSSRNSGAGQSEPVFFLPFSIDINQTKLSLGLL